MERKPPPPWEGVRDSYRKTDVVSLTSLYDGFEARRGRATEPSWPNFEVTRLHVGTLCGDDPDDGFFRRS